MAPWSRLQRFPLLLVFVGCACSRQCSARDFCGTEHGGEPAATTCAVAHVEASPRLLQISTRQQRSLGDVASRSQHCGLSLTVNFTSQKSSCPKECPFWAEDVEAGHFCTFKCVDGRGCRKVNSAAPVPDARAGICRGCRVHGCLDCRLDAEERCTRCKEDYTLTDGKCVGHHANTLWLVIYIFVAVLAALLVGWFANLLGRPIVNEAGVARGLRYREDCKLHQLNAVGPMPQEHFTGSMICRMKRTPWPLNTNLLHEPVAGVGVTLHFNFQLAVIAWAAAVSLAWIVLALMTDIELLTLGLSSVATPRDYCIVVQWGYRSQLVLGQIKETFVAAVYLLSTLAVFVHVICQRRRYVTIDDTETTMMDFAAICTGLPPLPGDGLWEDELKKSIQQEAVQDVVGVSICWDYRAQEEQIEAELLRIDRQMSELSLLKGEGGGVQSPRSPRIPKLGCLGGACQRTEGSLLHWLAEGSSPKLSCMEALLKSLKSTSTAFVVFNTEGARDDAVQRSKELGGLDFEGGKVHLSPATFEPASVCFQNVSLTARNRFFRLLRGVGVVILALAVWTGAFYFPYASYVLVFTSTQGQEPSFLHSFSFSLVVVVGNQVMYQACRKVATDVGFTLAGSLEACYMVLYSISIVFNVLVDLLVAYYLSYYRMLKAGTRTHDGTLLGDVATHLQIVESYVMQKDLGMQLSRYSFPATFLVPFLVEPVFLYLVPLLLMTVLVRRHPGISRAQAEDLFRPPYMDLGRYADILVNVTLAVLVFLFPGGYTLLTFGGLVLSHLYIYAYDHWRLLRAAHTLCVSSEILDTWASAMLCLPCGLLLSCAVFKTNCKGDFPCTADSQTIFLRCLTAFLVHVVVHVLVVGVVMPKLTVKKWTVSADTFEECSRLSACSWFTMNPVHCLRSEYIYEHTPPCNLYIVGKEHLMRANAAIGQHFEART